MIPAHWYFLNLGQGVHATDPYLPQFFLDELELGERAAYHLDDEREWGASMVILLMAAPGAPWEAHVVSGAA